MEQRFLLAMVANSLFLNSASAEEGKFPYADEELIGFYQLETCATGHDWGIDDENNSLGIYFHKSIEISKNNRFRINYIFFYDAHCSKPKVAGLWDGHYVLGEAHPRLPHTRLGDFTIDRVQLAIMDGRLMEATRGCGVGRWMVGLFNDITETGCTALGPLFLPTSVMKTDYDIVHLHDGVFKSGFRTPDMAADAMGRPTALQDRVPLVRQQTTNPGEMDGE